MATGGEHAGDVHRAFGGVPLFAMTSRNARISEGEAQVPSNREESGRSARHSVGRIETNNNEIINCAGATPWRDDHPNANSNLNPNKAAGAKTHPAPSERLRSTVGIVTAFAVLFGGQPLAIARGGQDSPPENAEQSVDAEQASYDEPYVLSDESSARGYSRTLGEEVPENPEQGDRGELDTGDNQTLAESGGEQPPAAADRGAASEAATALAAADRTGVSGKVLSVPSGEGTVKGMGESFSAQLSTGVATFSFPFSLPAARGGAQPSLALSYSSSGGFGDAGVGWSVGAPFIARQTERGIPNYDDQTTWHPDQDTFVFNGGQELVPICTVQELGGVASCNGALPQEKFPGWSVNWQYFRARVEGSFLRFFWSPDHQTWRVQDKSGVTMELGVPLDGSGYTGALEVNPGDNSEIFRWSITRQYDTYGELDSATLVRPHNVVVYRYQQVAGATYLTDIFDTTPSASLKSTDLSSYAHHTRLEWQLRTDKTHSYRSGWRIDQTQRLARVDVTSKPFVSEEATPRELLRRYHLSYDGRSHVSLLESVQVEGRCKTTAVQAGVHPERGATASGGGELGVTNCPRLPPMTFGYSHVEGYLADGTRAAVGFGGFEAFDERAVSLANSPSRSLDDTRSALLDVNGDGLEDLLVTEPGAFRGKHGLFLNGGGGEAGAFLPSDIAVSGVLGAGVETISLNNLSVVPLDVDGDAVVNLLHMPRHNQYSLYSPELQNGRLVWVGRAVRTADGLDARLDLAKDGFETKTMDVNFDGLIDVVRATGTELQTFYSLGRYPGGDGQFGSARQTSAETATVSTSPVSMCVPWSGTPLRFGDKEVLIADMNGDGITDIVKLKRGDVRYWPGRGNGFWGTGKRDDCLAGTFGQGRDYTMANSPYISDVEQSNVQLNDVNGDGLADLVQIRANEVDIWLNLNGEGWSDLRVIKDTPASPSFQNRVRLTDINGSGTPDILWGDANDYKYIDLQGGKRPWLLTTIANGLGKSTTIEYSTSTAEMLQAEREGRPWSKTMPIVISVVKRLTEHDNLRIAGRPPQDYVTEYSYRDPVYEGRQREFRGFSSGETKAVGDSNSPTSITRTEFLLGECRDETPINGIAECALEERWRDNPQEALKGSPVINETYDESGNYLSSAHTRYNLKRLYRGLDGRDVRWAYPAGTTTYLYDTGAFRADPVPLVTQEATASTEYVTSLPGDGDAPNTTHPFVRRSSKGYRKTQSEVVLDNFGNSVTSIAKGVVGGDGVTAPDEIISRHQRPQLVDSSLSQWLWRTKRSCITGSDHQPPGYAPDPGDPCSGTVTAWDHTTNTYDSHGQLLQADVVIEGSVLMHRSENAEGDVGATRSAGVNGPATIDAVSRTTYDPNTGVVTDSRGAHYRHSELTYDTAFGQLVTAEAIHTQGAGLAALTGVADTVLVSQVLEYDRGLAAPLEMSDIGGHFTKTVFDGFGRIVATHAPDPDTGAAQELPTSTFSYALPPESGGNFIRIHSRSQDGAGGETQAYLESYTYQDGFNRPIATLMEAEKEGGGNYGDDEARRWIVGAMHEWDAKGAVRRKYLEFFTTQDPEKFAFHAPPNAPYGRQRYDAFGRQFQSFDLDGTVTLQSVYHALSKDMWDAADLQPGRHQGTPVTTRTDGHGRVVESIERFHASNVVRSRHTLTQYTPQNHAEVIRRRLDGQASGEVTRWFAYDSLGRLVLNVSPDWSLAYSLNSTPNVDFQHESRSAHLAVWRYGYNDAGDLVSSSDARGCGTNFIVDGAGRVLGEDYFRCESHHAPHTPASYMSASTGSALETLYEYDVPSTQNLGATPPSCTTDPGTTKGRLVRTRDLASDGFASYDHRGRITCSAIRVAKPRAPQVRPTVDGTPAPQNYEPFSSRYTPRWYQKSFAFDAADRRVEETTGAKLLTDGGVSSITTAYSARGTVGSVNSSYVTGFNGNSSLVTHVERDADNLVTKIGYGDRAGTMTTYTHDERRRIRNMLTARGKVAEDSWQDAPTDPRALADFRHQLVLQDDEVAYDVVNNPIEVRDYRINQEWAPSAKPVHRRVEYDDLYRATRIEYDYAAGSDLWQSPFHWELGARPAGFEDDNDDPRSAKPSPHVRFAKRMQWQHYQYDWLGNTATTDDDAKGFYDRSLGEITNGTPEAGPYQLKSAVVTEVGPQGDKAGSLDAVYDAAGNMTELLVQRNGECLGGTSTGEACSHAFVYLWDELGRLTEALRVDGSGNSPSSVSPDTFGAQLQYRYGANNQRFIKTAYDFAGGSSHTIYAFQTLELRSAPFVDSEGDEQPDDYALNELTEVPYLVGNGIRLARVAFMPNSTPDETPLSTIEKANTNVGSGQVHLLFELGDRLGSSSVVLDKATGELVERTTYQAFGGTESDYRPPSFGGYRSDYRFTGKEEDTEVGLIYFGERFYNPLLQRWLSPDPASVHTIDADLNVYAYVSGYVLKGTDPIGFGFLDYVRGLGAGAVEAGSALKDGAVSMAQNVAEKAVDIGMDVANGNFEAARNKTLQAGKDVAVGAVDGALATFESVKNLPSQIENAVMASSDYEAGRLAFEPVTTIATSATGIGAVARTAVKKTLVKATFKKQGAKPRAKQSPPRQQGGTCSGTQCNGTGVTPGCFIAGTLVLTSRGLVPIEQVVAGDFVLALNPNSGEGEQWREVVAAFQKTPGQILDLELVDEDGAVDIIAATSDHPFWTARAGWTKAGDLRVSDQLWSIERGWLYLRTLLEHAQAEPVYNLEVAQDHTFFVGKFGAWVHNEGCPNGGAPEMQAEGLEQRANQIHSVLDPRAQRARTTAVTEAVGPDGSVTRVVSSSEPRLSPAQRKALAAGEVEGVGVGHAEVTGVEAARRMGLTPTQSAASRPICPNCASALESQGVAPASPLKR